MLSSTPYKRVIGVNMEKKYWPFHVLPIEEHKREIRFLEGAHRQGFKAYMMGGLAFGAEGDSGKEGIIMRRGRNRWEVSLGANQKEETSAFYQDFAAASEAVLTWLHG
jgi:hypothetical protein